MASHLPYTLCVSLEKRALYRHKEDITVTTFKTIPSQPGQYRFKPHALLPWLSVQLVKESVMAQQNMQIRCAGLTFRANGVFHSGVWQGPLK